MKSKKILVLIITTLIVVLFANIKIIKSKTLGSSEIVSDNEIVNDIQETNDIQQNTDEIITEQSNIQENSICESDNEIKKEQQEEETVQEEIIRQKVEKPKQTTKLTQEKKVESSSPQKEKVTIQTTTSVTNNKQETQVQEQPKTEIRVQESEIPKCNGNNHGVGTGNSGRWFNNELETVAYYKSIIKTWGDKWEEFEIDDETYHKNCPYGYEDWSCPYCGKWTINFYYN